MISNVDLKFLADIVNGTFEAGGTYAIWLSVKQIYKDKRSAGISHWQFWYFGSWGLWNLVYYPVLGQPLSFIGGIGVVSMNITWLILHYRYREN